MAVKLALSITLVAGALLSQAQSTGLGLLDTGGMANGRAWTMMPDAAKTGYVLGSSDTASFFSGRDGCNISRDRYTDAYNIFTHLTISEVIKELDVFYSEPSNLPIPILMARRWVAAKAGGGSAEYLGKLLANYRTFASGAVEIENKRQ
ncbi:MAG TPA: hypothetical protein VMU80_23015 [Bryobacteraceae bacterium]|nr:hypothetical protein [Bryobacteraceae bacterium]